MVCDSIQEAVVEFMDGTDKNTMKKTLQKLLGEGNVTERGGTLNFAGRCPNGKFLRGTYNNGIFTFPDPGHKFAIKLIKVAYSETVVEMEAERMQWDLRKEGNKYFASKKYSKDVIEIEILKDGIIKTTNDKISPANHASAEMFLLNMARAAGGTVTRRNKHASASTTGVQQKQEN